MKLDDGYRPPRWLAGGDLQTIVPALWPLPPLVPDESIVVPVSDQAALRVDVNQPSGAIRGTLLLIHGMGGCSASRYMTHTARAALQRGWTAARINLRTCGGTERLSKTLYNAGQSDDLQPVLAELDRCRFSRPFAVAGFSLGGNLALRYAGRSGADSAADAFAAVNPPVDLRRCVTAIEQPRNRLYQAHYARTLRRQMERFLDVHGPVYESPRALGVVTLRQFDEAYTAVDGGFASAADYYQAASSGPFLADMRRPAWILSAANDPFVPTAMFEAFQRAPSLRLTITAQGGHCGFWGRGRPRYWAGQALMDFFEAQATG